MYLSSSTGGVAHNLYDNRGELIEEYSFFELDRVRIIGRLSSERSGFYVPSVIRYDPSLIESVVTILLTDCLGSNHLLSSIKSKSTTLNDQLPFLPFYKV